MDDLSCDVAIIGAGTAGLAAERAARKAGAKTLLVDDRFAGTTCASVGCMPSKLLIAAADAAFNARKASTFGIETKTSVDGRAVMTRVRKERDRFVAETLPSRPFSRSYETFWPSTSEEMPARSSAVTWTKASFCPSSGWMKPKPLVVLKNFTVPLVAMRVTF